MLNSQATLALVAAAVFATEDAVVTVEAGGDRAHFDKLDKAVSASIRSLEID